MSLGKRFELTLGLTLILLFLIVSTGTAATNLTVNSSRVSGDVGKHEYDDYSFYKKADWTYVAYLSVNSGDADLYGNHNSNVGTSNYQFGAQTSGTNDDFFRFESTKNGTYYLSVYGYNASSYSIYVVGFPTDAPQSLRGRLVHPLGGDSDFTYNEQGRDYGLFASPWGNPHEEFFPNSRYYHHTGVDWEVDHGTTVKAAHSGYVHIGNAGGSWGYYVEIEGTVGGIQVTTTYMHLQFSDRPREDEWVNAGEPIGKIYDVSHVNGEKSHLHFTIYLGESSSSARVGSLKYNQFPGNFINPEDNALYGSDSSYNTSSENQYIDKFIEKYSDYFGSKSGVNYTCYTIYTCQNLSNGKTIAARYSDNYLYWHDGIKWNAYGH